MMVVLQKVIDIVYTYIFAATIDTMACTQQEVMIHAFGTLYSSAKEENSL